VGRMVIQEFAVQSSSKREVERPVPSSGEALVRVFASWSTAPTPCSEFRDCLKKT